MNLVVLDIQISVCLHRRNHVQHTATGGWSPSRQHPWAIVLHPFTNELPEVVHGDNCPLKDVEGGEIFNTQCQECGGVCCYADDSTYSVQGNDPVELSTKLSEKYVALADFLTANELKVNDDKTHLLVMSTRQKRQHRDTSSITITTPTAIITPSKVERLLGAQVHHDMHWKEHLLDNDDSLLTSLVKRSSAIK